MNRALVYVVSQLINPFNVVEVVFEIVTKRVNFVD